MKHLYYKNRLMICGSMLLLFIACRPDSGASVSGHDRNPLNIDPEQTPHSINGMMASVQTQLTTVNDLIGISLLNAIPQDQQALASPTDEYCLDDFALPLAKEGEDQAGTGFEEGQLSPEHPSYAQRQLYCQLQKNTADSLINTFSLTKQLFCVLGKMKDNPLSKTENLETEQEVAFIFSSECFDTATLVKVQNKLGTLQGKFVAKREIHKDSWNEVLTFTNFNWQHEAASIHVKAHFGEAHLTLSALHLIGEKAKASEFFLLQTDNKGRIFLERQKMHLNDQDFQGSPTNVDNDIPYNMRLKFSLHGTRERELTKISQVHSLEYATSNLGIYHDGTTVKYKGSATLVTGNTDDGFYGENNSCFDKGTDLCSAIDNLTFFKKTSSCAPSSHSCSQASATYTEESFPGFAMASPPKEENYLTPEERFEGLDPSELQSSLGL